MNIKRVLTVALSTVFVIGGIPLNSHQSTVPEVKILANAVIEETANTTQTGYVLSPKNYSNVITTQEIDLLRKSSTAETEFLESILDDSCEETIFMENSAKIYVEASNETYTVTSLVSETEHSTNMVAETQEFEEFFINEAEIYDNTENEISETSETIIIETEDNTVTINNEIGTPIEVESPTNVIEEPITPVPDILPMGGSATIFFDGFDFEPITITIGTTLQEYSLPIPEQNNAIFDGWYSQDGILITGDNLSEAFTELVGGAETTLYARFSPITINEPEISAVGGSATIYFDGFDFEPITITIGTTLQEYSLPIPVQENAVFDGWYTHNSTLITGSNLADAFDTLVTGANTTLYARFSPLVICDPIVPIDGGSATIYFDGFDFEPLTISIGTAIQEYTLPIPSLEGAVFDGWYTQDGTLITGSNLTDAFDILISGVNATLYARFHIVEDSIDNTDTIIVNE